jgi:radical SAM superfamily enzyme YgiQ (UPF0313 family)
MNVLLISANTNTDPYAVYPLGLDYVAGAIADRHRVRVVDMNTLDGVPALAAVIRDFEPRLVGIGLRNVDTTDTTNLQGFVDSYRELVATVRRACRAVVVLGGSGFTIFPRQMMRYLAADYGVVGEGERLAQLVEAIDTGRDPSGMTGIMTPEDGETIPAPLDQIPPRRFSGVGDLLPFYLRRGGILNLQTKRGCRFRCIYCTYPHIEGRRLRYTAPAQAARTALALQDAGARYLFITDAVFNADFEHSATVARAFKEAGVTVPWGAFLTPTDPPDGYYDQLAQAGMTHAEFGTEALSDTVLKAYRKPFRSVQVFRAHGAAQRAGLHVAHYLLPGGPGETPATLAETLDNAEKLRQCVLFFFCGMRIYPHTDLYETALRQGLISETQSLLEPVFYRTAGLSATQITAQVRQRAGNRINWVVGSGGPETAALVERMYSRGYSGPLWEYLAR